jgi:hypothetical protein
MLDIRPPDSAFIEAFAYRALARVTMPGLAPIDGVEVIELPPRSELQSVAGVEVLDVMTTLALPVVKLGRVPVGTRVELEGRVTAPWTVRRVYGERDDPEGSSGWVLVGVA